MAAKWAGLLASERTVGSFGPEAKPGLPVGAPTWVAPKLPTPHQKVGMAIVVQGVPLARSSGSRLKRPFGVVDEPKLVPVPNSGSFEISRSPAITGAWLKYDALKNAEERLPEEPMEKS